MAARNVKIASETKECALAKELVGPNIKAESLPCFTFSLENKEEELRQAPMAYIPNMVAKVIQLLDQNDKYIFLLD